MHYCLKVESHGASRRAEERIPLFGIHQVSGGKHSVSVIVENVSTLGCMIRSEGAPIEGDTIIVTFESIGVVEAHIVWRDENRIGCQFATRLTSAQLKSIRDHERVRSNVPLLTRLRDKLSAIGTSAPAPAADSCYGRGHEMAPPSLQDARK